MSFFRRRLLLLPVALLGAAVLACLAAAPATAAEIDNAKAEGWIGERRDGYLGLVDGAPASARTLVERVNAGRRTAYELVAASNEVPRDQVEALAGQKLIARAKAGEYIMDAAGRWIRK